MNVELPDGTVVEDVPEGISRADLAIKLKANGMAVPSEWLGKRKVGPVETALRTAGEAARTAVGMFDMAAAGLASTFGGSEEADRVLAMREERQQGMRTAYAQKPDEEFSGEGQLLGGVASMPIEMVGGMGVQHGIERSTEVLDRGGSMGQAAGAGAVTGGVRAALNALPVKAGGAVGKAVESRLGGIAGGAATGGAIAGAGGMAGRAAENAALPEGEQFKDLQQDTGPDLVEIGMGAAFGALPGAAGKVKRKPKAEAPQPFPADKMTDLGDGEFRAPNGATITAEAWENASPRVREGWMKAAEKVPVGEAKELDIKPEDIERQAELDRLKEEHPAGPVAEALQAIEAKRAKETEKAAAQAKTRDQAAELRRAAGLTSDPEVQAELRRRADKLDPPEKIPTGKVIEGEPALPDDAPKKPLPVGEATELPDTPSDGRGPDLEPLPVGEATEVTRSGVEPGDPPPPVGEARELYVDPQRGGGAPPPPKAAPDPAVLRRREEAYRRAAEEALAQGDKERYLELSKKADDLFTQGEEARLAQKGKPDGQRLRPDDLQPETRAQEPQDAPEEAGARQGATGKEADETVRLREEALDLGLPRIDENFMRVQEQAQKKAAPAAAPPSRPPTARGIKAVRQVLEEGRDGGKLDKDGADLALWALERNPHLAHDLSMSVRDRIDGGVAKGSYNSTARIVTIFKSHDNPQTATHEILHHSERMMPPAVQQGIRRAWQRAADAAAKEGGPKVRAALEDARKATLGDKAAFQRMISAFRDGSLDAKKHYQLVDPSEFWAVNGARILHERFTGRGSWRAQARQWLREMVAKVKDIVGLRSDAPILRALDEMLDAKKVTGARLSDDMIKGASKTAPAKTPTKKPGWGSVDTGADSMDIDTPAFKRWFGGSKVVDEKGKPLRVYHGTASDISKFDNRSKYEGGIYFTADPRYAGGRARIARGMGHGEAPNVMPVYVRIKNPAPPSMSVAQAKAAGHDGIIRENEFVAFDAGQIKSATGNRGTFDPNDPDILMDIDPGPTRAKLAEESGAEEQARRWIDSLKPVERAQAAVAPKGEAADMRLAMKLAPGRIGERARQLEQNVIKPLGKAMKAAKRAGLSVKDVDDYLTALHAPERNAVIAQRNPKMADGGSGLTNAQAQEILDGFTPEQRQHLAAVAKLVHDMNRRKLDQMVEDGLIKPEVRDRLNKQYKRYVPLKTLDKEDEFHGVGRGFEMRPNDITSALGRTSRASSPVAGSIMDATRTIARGERARVDRAIWEYAQADEAKGLLREYDPDQPPPEVMRNALGKDGQVKQEVDPRKLQEHVVSLVVNGEQKRIYVPNVELAEALRTAGDPQRVGRWLQAYGTLTRGFSRTLTEWNPAFAPVNVVKDTITAAVRAKRLDLDAAAVVAGVPGAMRDIVRLKRGKGGDMYREMKAVGGAQGAYGLTRFDDTLGKLEKLGAELGYDEHKGGAGRKLSKALGLVGDALSHFNEVFEYSVRLSAYRNAKAKGMTPAKAAAAARDITLDFNVNGEVGRRLGHVYSFFNAAVQGITNDAKDLRDKRTRLRMLSLMGVGAAVQAANEVFGGVDEDTDEKNVDLQHEGVLDSNVVLTPLGVKIPLPPGLPAGLYAVGRRLAKMAFGGDVEEEAAGAVAAMAKASVPVRIGESDAGLVSNVLTAVVPSIPAPFYMLEVNRDGLGRPIIPEQHGKADAPHHTVARRTTSSIAKGISEGANTITGGDDVTPGAAQRYLGKYTSPEAIEFIVGYYTGGVGQFALQSKNIAANAAEGKPQAVDKIPVLKRFIATEPQGAVDRRYKELVDDFERAKKYQKLGQEDKIKPAVLNALPEYLGAEKELTALFKQWREATDTTERERIGGEIKQVQSRVIKAFNQGDVR